MNKVEQADKLQAVIENIKPNIVTGPKSYFTLKQLQEEFRDAGVKISPSWWRAAARSGRLTTGKIHRTTVVDKENWDAFVEAGGFYQGGRSVRSRHDIQFAEGLTKLNLRHN